MIGTITDFTTLRRPVAPEKKIEICSGVVRLKKEGSSATKARNRNLPDAAGNF